MVTPGIMPPVETSIRSTPCFFRTLAKVDGLIEIPASGGPIGRGNAHQHRHGVGDDGNARRPRLRPVCGIRLSKRSAVFILALVDQRIEELRQQIAVGRMNFHRVEADIISTPSGVAELVDDGMDFVNGEFARVCPTARNALTLGPTVCLSALLFRHAHARIRWRSSRWKPCVRHG